jgi:AAA domain
MGDIQPPWIDAPWMAWDPQFVDSPMGRQRLNPSFQPTFKDIEQDITSLQDYVTAFCEMLQEEYHENTMLYNRYTQYNVTVRGRTFKVAPEGEETSRGILEIPGIFDARPALQFGDRVVIRPMNFVSSSNLEIVATVVNTIRGKRKNQKDRVVITWLPKAQAAILANAKVAVRFFPRTAPFDRCLAALKWLQTNIDRLTSKELLFPSQHPKVNPVALNLHDPEMLGLNHQQLQFVHLVMSRSASPTVGVIRPPMILTGPAGTGKTKTLLMALMKCLDQDMELLESSEDSKPTRRILVCTPSHTACDVITRRISQHLSNQRIFRMYDTSRPVETVPVEMLAFAHQNATGDFVLPSIEKIRRFQVIVCTCSDAHMLFISGMTNKSLRLRKQALATYVLDTVNASGMTIPVIEGVDQPFFSHLFIDEAAQVSEPENLIPFSVVIDDAPGIQKVEIALSGDPRQLNPDVYSRFAGPGLQKSLLERFLRLPEFGGHGHLLGPPTKDTWRTIDELIEYSFQGDSDRYLAVFLTTSYRGHPSFLHIPSKLFYLDKLKSFYENDVEEDPMWCQALRRLESRSTLVYPCSDKKESWPLHFLGVIGTDISLAVESFWGSNSWCNREEAEAVADTVESLHASGVSTNSIGVMAAFRAQVLYIRKLLRGRRLEAINVGMVEDYQAVEREVIVISLTRSNDMFVTSDIDRNSGLFHQPKRVNVALTRAEKLMIVIGNPLLMKKDPLWSVWLDYCREHGLWYGEGA